MDVSAQKCNISDKIDCTHNEPCPPLNNLLTSTLKLQLGNKANIEQDALEAVKLDPAVLEAQITVETGSNRKEEPISSRGQPSEQHTEGHTRRKSTFENVMSMQEAALLSLEPEQFEFLMMYAEALRRKRIAFQKTLECAFCKNNGESLSWYTSHALKDERGRVRCPVLRCFRCPRCGATRDRAHTIKYCPEHLEPGN